MCGIHFTLSRTPPAPTDLPPDLRRCLHARGPDHFGQVHRRVRCVDPSGDSGDGGDGGDSGGDASDASDSGTAAWSLRFTSTVLALRGDHVAPQPLTDGGGGEGSVLCWNGEAWRVGGERVPGNDGEVVFARLAAGGGGGGGGVDAVLDVLRGIEGPFAFVYYDATVGKVFFGRDRLGRRSLLMAPARQGGLALCSVAGEAGEGWREVEADGVYVVAVGKDASPERYDWVVGEDAAGFVSTLAWSAAVYAFDRGRPSCQTYFTLSRFPALAGSIRRCPLVVLS